MPLLALFAAAAMGQGSSPAIGSQPLQAAVSRASAEGFRGQVVAGDKRSIAFDQVVGLDRAPDRWIWGSVSKQVTATLVMTQVERGRLSLDDTVRKWLPEFANAETGQATVRDLLQHTSGLANPDGGEPDQAMPAFYARRGGSLGGAADALGICAGAAAGERGTFRYNNCDTIVAGAILERSSGQSFSTLLKTRLARPFKLYSMRLTRDGETLRPIAGRWMNVANLGPAGAVTGSARDLLRFNQALLSGKLISDAGMAVMWKGEPKLGYVALGAWEFSARLRGCGSAVRLVERRGEVAGVQSRNIIAPELGKSLVVFTDQAERDFGEIWRGAGLSFDLASAAFCGG
jgi:CubicO group peptidase (beta-lactamase class C family)